MGTDQALHYRSAISPSQDCGLTYRKVRNCNNLKVRCLPFSRAIARLARFLDWARFDYLRGAMTEPAPPDATYQEAISFLYGRINYEQTAVPNRSKGLNLQRMHDLLALLDNPHRQLRVIHLAGTKGKGSTATLVSAILQAAGFRVGLYTSPHLCHLEERFVVDGVRCDEGELSSLVAAVQPAVAALDAVENAAHGPTFFEITTALAMLHFVRRAVDFAVFEVGLGGRLDSTNVCQPLVAVITSISFDHTRQLGKTLTDIAAEKAGIIKPGVPVVSGVQQAEPRAVIQQTAQDRGCRLLELGTDFGYSYAGANLQAPDQPLSCFDYREGGEQGDRCYDQLSLELLGEHQVANAAVAVAAVHRLVAAGHVVPESAIRRGLSQVRLPARVELISREPCVVVDTAHNVASAQALVEVLAEIRQPQRRFLVFATTRDKDASGMLRLLLPAFDEVAITRYRNNPRGVDPEELAGQARQLPGRGSSSPKIHVFSEPIAAWNWSRAIAQTDDLICVAGSFFLAAELRELALRDHSE